MKCPLIRMSDLRIGDMCMFTPESAIQYLEYHPGAPVDRIVFVVTQIMAEQQFVFLGQKGEVMRYACLGHMNYEIQLLWRDERL